MGGRNMLIYKIEFDKQYLKNKNIFHKIKFYIDEIILHAKLGLGYLDFKIRFDYFIKNSTKILTRRMFDLKSIKNMFPIQHFEPEKYNLLYYDW